MSTTLVYVLYLLSLVLVVWTVVDVARRPAFEMPSQKKALWIIGSIVGWMIYGFVGAAVAIVYLMGPRKRLNGGRSRI